MTAEIQTSNAVLLVRPAAFGYHAEAAATNAFAQPCGADAAALARREFAALAEGLARAGVQVLVLEDAPDPAKPDATFPNNWVSFHADGTIALYPMATAARRPERNAEGLKGLLAMSGFDVRRTVDLTGHEEHGRFLEGTGSLILDRPARRAFAAVGPRTCPEVIADFDRQLGYSTFVFDARDRSGRPIYHTNVLLSLGTRFAILCMEAVAPAERRALAEEIERGGRTIIEADYEQMRQFACNLLELRGRGDEPVIALSAAALASLRPDQLRLLESFGQPVPAAIPTIEAAGGGSVRCMIADVHLPRAGAPVSRGS